MTKLLLPLAWIFDAATRLRNALFDAGVLRQRRFAVPVVTVGNLAVGGTGKTPHTEMLLRLLLSWGRRPAMLSRGYGRQTSGYREGAGASPEEIGDEPYQVAHNVPEARIAVCEDRCEGIERLLDGKAPAGSAQRAFVPDVIVLDDAFQHRRVHPGLAIVLTEYGHLYVDDALMPAGRLRESPRGAARADIIVVTKCPAALSAEEMQHIERRLGLLPHQQLFFTNFAYGALYAFSDASRRPLAAPLSGRNALIFCGIARPAPLVRHIEAAAPKHVSVKTFRDHHRFSADELEALSREAEAAEALVVTTEKDAARLSTMPLPDYLRAHLIVQPIAVDFADVAQRKAFEQRLGEHIDAPQ